MKKVLGIILAVVLLAAGVGGGLHLYYTKQVDAVRQQLTEEQEQEDLLQQKLQEMGVELDTTKGEKDSLLQRIDEMLTEDVVVFNAAAVKEEIQEIGELATVEYLYTDVGTFDASKTLFKTDWKLPLTQKSALITMDGVIKAGIDVEAVNITCDEAARTITVDIPEAKILSNELDENSLQVYNEKNGLFNEVTLEDGGSLRSEIKEKAQAKALENGILQQAEENAKYVIQSIIESTPSIKETYTITYQ